MALTKPNKTSFIVFIFITILCVCTLITSSFSEAYSSNRAREASRLFNKGIQAFNSKEYESAYQLFNSSLEIFERIGNLQSGVDVLTWIAATKIELDDEVDINSIIDLLKKLKTICAKNNIYPSAKAAFHDLPGTIEILEQYSKAKGYIVAQDYQSGLEILNKCLQKVDEMGKEQFAGGLWEKYLYELKTLMLLIEAFKYEQQGDNKSAALKIDEISAISKNRADTKNEANRFLIIGNFYSRLMQYDKALDQHSRALDFYKRVGNINISSAIEGRINLIEGMKLFYGTEKTGIKFNKSFMKSKDYFEKALIIGEKLNNEHLIFEVQSHLDLFYFLIGDYENAIKYAEKTISYLKKRSQLTPTKIIIYNNALSIIADSYKFLGNLPKSLEYLQEHLKFAEEKKDLTTKLKVLENISGVYIHKGEYQRAIEIMQDYISIARQGGFKLAEVDGYMEIGEIFNGLGDIKKAIEYTSSALNIVNQKPEDEDIIGLKSRIYSSLGGLYGDSNFTDLPAEQQLSKSIYYYEKSLTECQKLKNRLYEGIIHSSMATTYWYFGDNANAFENIEKAIEIHKAVGSDNYLIGDYNYAGKMYADVDDYSRSLELYNSALVLAKKLNKFTEIHNIYLGKSYLYVKMGSYQDALSSLKNAWEMVEFTKLRNYKIVTLQHLGSVSAISGNLGDAVTYFAKGIELIESSRENIRTEEVKISFGSDIHKLNFYTNIIKILTDLDRVEEAFHYSERARARTLLDQLGNKLSLENERDKKLYEDLVSYENKIATLTKSIEKLQANLNINNKIKLDLLTKQLDNTRDLYSQLRTEIKSNNPELYSLINVEPISLGNLQNLLDSETSILEYYFAGDMIILWIIDSTSVKTLKISLDNEDFSPRVFGFLKGIRSLSPDYYTDAQNLYDLLIKPAKPYIRSKRICIVPHFILNYVPFHALLNTDEIDKKGELNKKGKFLIEEYDISYLPSSSILKYLSRKRKATSGDILAFGNPDLGDDKLALPHAEDEVNVIKKTYPKSAVYLGKNATESKVKQLCGSFNIIHFASHGELNPNNPLLSNLRLSQDQYDDGRLEVREIFNLDFKNTSLVILSACDTGLGKLTFGDDLVGLTRGFFYAGTPSIIASLWKVNDKSTSQLMSLFYKNLKSYNKGTALKLAQIEMIRGEVGKGIVRSVGGITTSKEEAADQETQLTVNGSHPYFWAPFVLIGDWQ